MNASQSPWHAVTPVDLFSLATCTNVVKTGCSSPSSLNTAFNQAVYNDAKAIKTAAGKTPLVTSDVDPTTSFDIGADVNRYVDQFNMMSYGHTCANNCSQLAADIAALKNNSGIPASKITV